MVEARLSAPQIAAIRSRWTTVEIDRVNGALSAGEVASLPRFAPGAPSTCLYDLRGLLLTTPVIDQHLSHVDLSYSFIPEGTLRFGGFGRTQLTDCRFVGADLRSGNIVVTATRCDFSYGRFQELMGVFEDCIFRDSNLSRVNAPRLRFVRCDFTAANMLNFHALHGTFDQCVWEATKLGRGSFAWTHFIGSWPPDEALGNTIMDGVRKDA